MKYLETNKNHRGDSRILLPKIEPNSVAVSFWSPPYFVGKNYEKDYTFETYQDMLRDVIKLHFTAIRPGGFVVVNIGDILAFQDEAMPKIQAKNISKQRFDIALEEILLAIEKYPGINRDELAKLFGCSEQTIDRRLNGNNIRGGKHSNQTRVKVVGGFIEQAGIDAGFYMYDRRIWIKDPAWANNQWHSLSYRSVDETEYLYVLWKPGITTVNRNKLTPQEWSAWGSRGAWTIRSVRKNDYHEAMFPLELARRVVRLYSEEGDTVLDAFMGSGQTAIAALEENRNYIGLEREEEYVKLANYRIKNHQAKLKLPLDQPSPPRVTIQTSSLKVG